ncbi:MAG: hypothetical protein WDO18_18065 [Acidobacteriota bacterium]
MSTLLQQIEAAAIFSWIRSAGYAYPALLWVHLITLSVWAGLMLVASGEATAYRPAKRISFLLAALFGVLLFGAKAGQYAYNPWFWIKMSLLLLMGVSTLIFRGSRSRLGGWPVAGVVDRLRFALARPATIRDLMHAMVDPSANSCLSRSRSFPTNAASRKSRRAPMRTGGRWGRARTYC